MTKGLFISINSKNNMLRKVINYDPNSQHNDRLKTNFETYQKIHKETILEAKSIYLRNLFSSYRHEKKHGK